MMRLLGDASTGGGIAGIAYEVALRAVGQDLAALLFESLEIKVEDKILVARGRCISHATEAIQESSDGFVRKAWQSLTGRGARENKEPLFEPFVRKYGPEDINRLDELGKMRQTSAPKIPDLSSLAEALRTVGRTVDAKGGSLVRLIKSARSIVFVYEDVKGQHTARSSMAFRSTRASRKRCRSGARISGKTASEEGSGNVRRREGIATAPSSPEIFSGSRSRSPTSREIGASGFSGKSLARRRLDDRPGALYAL